MNGKDFTLRFWAVLVLMTAFRAMCEASDATPAAARVRTVDLVEMTSESATLTRGEEFPGAKGELMLVRDGVRPFMRLACDLTKGAYVGMEFREPLPEGTQRIRFDCRLTSAAPTARVFFRFSDRDSQYHLQGVPVGVRGDWQTLEFDVLRSGGHWGTKVNDGVVRLPAAGFVIGLELRGAGDRTGTLDVRKVELVTTAAEEALPSAVVRICSPRFGALYRPQETVEIDWHVFVRDGSAQTDGRTMTVTDWQGRPVCTRKLAAGDTSGRERFTSQDLGGRFGAFRAGIGTAETWFARLTTADDPKPCRWLGTGTHSSHGWGRGDFRYLDLLTAAGIGIVRDEVSWGSLETEKGVYRMSANFEHLVNELQRRGIRFNNLLNSKNPVYENPLDPEAFARYCAWHVRTLGARCDLYEIWNEPHNFCFYQVYKDVYGYGQKKDERGNPELPWIPRFVELSRKAAAAIRQANPAAEVAVCAEDCPQLLEKMLELGIATPREIVTVHNYDHSHYPPEGDWFNSSDGRDLRAFGAKYGAVRFAATEDGWTTYRGGPNGEYAFVGNYPPCNPEQQARYVVRMFLTGRQNGLEYMVQYDFRDDGPRRNYTEHNFGLVHEDYSPKPSLAAVAYLTRSLGASEPAGDIGKDHAAYRLYRFRQPDGTMTYVGWSIAGERTVERPAELSGEMTVTDMQGNPKVGVVQGDRLILTENPVYFRVSCLSRGSCNLNLGSRSFKSKKGRLRLKVEDEEGQRSEVRGQTVELSTFCAGQPVGGDPRAPRAATSLCGPLRLCAPCCGLSHAEARHFGRGRSPSAPRRAVAHSPVSGRSGIAPYRLASTLTSTSTSNFYRGTVAIGKALRLISQSLPCHRTASRSVFSVQNAGRSGIAPYRWSAQKVDNTAV